MRAPNVGVALLCLGLGLGAVSIFATHPLFAAGIWSDAEPLGSLFFLAAGVCCAGLGILAATDAGTLNVVRHPFVVLSSALGLWSLLTSPLVEFPFLSILGPPQTAQGAIWYLAFAAFVAAALIVRTHDRLFIGLVATSAFAALVASLFNLRFAIGIGPATTMLAFNEHLAYSALGLIVVGAALLSRERRSFALAIVACGLVTLLVSRNRTAMAAVAIVGPLALAVRAIPQLRRLESWCEQRTHATHAAVLAGVGLLALVPYLLVRFVPTPDFLVTLWSRQNLFKVLEPSLLESVKALAVGHGWGHYSEYLMRNFPVAVTRTYATEWGDAIRDEFHSHNAFLEALFAAGLPGLAAMVGLPAAVVLGAGKSMRLPALAFAACWMLIDGTWFMMPSAIVALALCIALLSDVPSASAAIKGRAVIAIAWFATALLGVTASVATHANARAMTRLKDCLPPNAFASSCSGISIPTDPRGADLGTASLVATGATAAYVVQQGSPSRQSELVLLLLKESRDRVQAHGSVTLATARYKAYARALLARANGPADEDEFLFEAWRQDVMLILDRAPHRLDILPAYLNVLLARGREESMREALGRVATFAPQHPIVSWFNGILLLRAPDPQTREQGLMLMRQSLANGLENFMPVSQGIKARLTKSGGG